MNNLTISEQRKKALSILSKSLNSPDCETIDYYLDDACRKALNLSPRPDKTLPYVGWMIGDPEKTKAGLSLSAEGLEFIKSFEGCRLGAYLCPAKVWTIGYGHTRTAKGGQVITQAQAEILLKRDLAEFEQFVKDYVRVPLNQGQYDALVSLCFNIGATAFRRSSLLRSLNQGKYNTAAQEFHRWTNANGKQLPGLVRRRNDEYGMFVGE